MELYEIFQNFLNGQHTNITFTTENEKEKRMSLLNVQIIHKDKKFTISVYRKPVFSGTANTQERTSIYLNYLQM